MMFTEDDIPQLQREGRARWSHDFKGLPLNDADAYMIASLNSAAEWIMGRVNQPRFEGDKSLLQDYAIHMAAIAKKLQEVVATEQPKETNGVKQAQQYLQSVNKWEGAWLETVSKLVQQSDHLAMLTSRVQYATVPASLIEAAKTAQSRFKQVVNGHRSADLEEGLKPVALFLERVVGSYYGRKK